MLASDTNAVNMMTLSYRNRKMSMRCQGRCRRHPSYQSHRWTLHFWMSSVYEPCCSRLRSWDFDVTALQLVKISSSPFRSMLSFVLHRDANAIIYANGCKMNNWRIHPWLKVEVCCNRKTFGTFELAHWWDKFSFCCRNHLVKTVKMDLQGNHPWIDL
jgi:hypothetical protein